MSKIKLFLILLLGFSLLCHASDRDTEKISKKTRRLLMLDTGFLLCDEKNRDDEKIIRLYKESFSPELGALLLWLNECPVEKSKSLVPDSLSLLSSVNFLSGIQIGLVNHFASLQNLRISVLKTDTNTAICRVDFFYMGIKSYSLYRFEKIGDDWLINDIYLNGSEIDDGMTLLSSRSVKKDLISAFNRNPTHQKKGIRWKHPGLVKF